MNTVHTNKDNIIRYSHLGCATEYTQEYDKSKLGLVVEWDDEGHVIEDTGSEIEQGVEQPEGEPLLIVASAEGLERTEAEQTAINENNRSRQIADSSGNHGG